MSEHAYMGDEWFTDRIVERALVWWARDRQKQHRSREAHRKQLRQQLLEQLRPVATKVAQLKGEWKRQSSRRRRRLKQGLPEWMVGKAVAKVAADGTFMGSNVPVDIVLGIEFHDNAISFTLRQEGDQLIIATARQVASKAS